MSVWESAQGRLGPAASWYASQGWSILPCYGIVGGRCTCGGAHAEPKDVGKHPSLPEWNKYATTDAEVVTQWWEKSPDMNIGVMCKASGFFVIDIDPRSGGPDSFEKFEARYNADLAGGIGNLLARTITMANKLEVKDGELDNKDLKKQIKF
jgi:hypothetical protein